MNTGGIGVSYESAENPEYIAAIQQMLANGMTIHEAELASGLSHGEFEMVFRYLLHLEICRCVPIKDGEILPPEKPMSYELFKKKYKCQR